MNGYICIKALVLGGIGYAAGNNIPAEAVLPGRVRALIKQGYISPADSQTANVATELPGETVAELQQLAEAEAHTSPERIIIPVTKDGGVLEVLAAPESVVAAACNLQLTAEDSIKAIEAMTDETALILIRALDGRKTVKAAAETRAKKLENDKAQSEEGQRSGDV